MFNKSKFLILPFLSCLFVTGLAFAAHQKDANESHASNKNIVEKNKKPRIGILTSGGDCSGLNSIIYSVYKRAKLLGYEVVGFKHGVHGMIHGDYEILDDQACTRHLLKKGGSILKSSTKALSDKEGNPMSKEDGDKAIIERYKELGLKGLIYIGGDGSTKVMKNILDKDSSLRIIAVPKTIDNDIANTDVAVGFSTVVSEVTNQISNIIDTAESHDRIMVIEVMGRGAGYIALHSGIAAGADAILIPEKVCDFKKLQDHLRKVVKEKGYAIVVVSEALEFEDFKYEERQLSETISRKMYGGVAKYISDKLQQCGLDSRSVILGHTQRGGDTSAEDRILAQSFGNEAVNLINKRETGYMLGLKNNRIEKTKLSKIKETTRNIQESDELLKLAKDQGIFVGG